MTSPTALVDKAGVLAAFPVWTVTITPAGGPAFVASNVPSGGVDALLASVGDIVRQARRESSRGSLALSLVATPDSGGSWWPETAFGPSAPLEGSTVSVSVEWGSTTATVFEGEVDEVVRLDRVRVELQAREGRGWADRNLLGTVTLEDWPDAPSHAVGAPIPLVLGRVPDLLPLLVDADRQAVLDASLTTTATELVVVDTAGFPGGGTLRSGDEEVTYASTTETTFSGVVRGVNGTTPDSHAPGAVVLEVGPLTYLVASHALYGAGAVTNLRLRTSSGGLVPLPATVTPTVTPTAPARVTLDRQPELVVAAALPPSLAFVDLDTVAHSDLPDAEASQALGLADGFSESGYARLQGTNATGGKRVAAVELPAGATISRAWVVVETFGQDEVETATSGAVGSSETTIPVADTTGFPSSGSVWLESGSQAAELVQYTGTTASSFTGCTRGANSETGGAVSHPSGARVSRGNARVFWSASGGAPSAANALGDVEVKPTTPENAGAALVPAAHAFDEAHGHEIEAHTHGWDTDHAHAAGVVTRLDGLAVAVKLGQGGGTGDPVAQGIVSFETVPELVAPDVAGAHDVTHTNVPAISGGYDRTNWWAVLFPSDPFEGDSRRLLGADFFVALSATGAGGVQQVARGIPTGPVDGPFPPSIHATAAVSIPPELAAGVAAVGGHVAVGGSHGSFVNDGTVSAGSPANGGDLDIVDTSSRDVFAVWGRDEGDDADRSLPVPQAGYIQLGTEFVAYTSAAWQDTAGQVVRLSGITRGAFGSTATSGAPGALAVLWSPRHVTTPVQWTQAGVGLGGVLPGDAGPTMGELAAAPGEIHVVQSRLGPVFASHAAGQDPAAYAVTVAEFMRGGSFVVPGGSLVPFDETTTNIFEQYDLSTRIVPRAPVLWIQAATNLQVHSAWVELLIEDETTPAELDAVPAAAQDPEPTQALGTSSLTWFDVSDLVDTVDDLEGAALTVRRDSSLGADDVLVLRAFYVVEVTGVTTTTREFPTELVVDVRGAGCTGPADTINAAELIEQVPVAGLGLTSGDVLDAADFAAAGALTYTDVGVVLDEQQSVEDAIHGLAVQSRLVPRWTNEGKLSVRYLPDRDSLPAVDATFDENDVARSSLRIRRGDRGKIVNAVTVRAGRDMLADDAPILTASASVAPANAAAVVDAPLLDSQVHADDLAEHALDYAAAVPVRPSWATFVQGLDVLPADLLELDHPDLSSSGLIVERVTIRPNLGRAGFVTLEARDLAPP